MDALFSRLVTKAQELAAADGAGLARMTSEGRGLWMAGCGLLRDASGALDSAVAGLLLPGARTGRWVRIGRREVLSAWSQTHLPLAQCGSLLLLPIATTAAHAVLVLCAEREQAFPERADGPLLGFSDAIAALLDCDDPQIRLARDAELVNNERRFRAFMDALPAVAWIKDEGGRFVYFNRRVNEHLNTSCASLLGKTVFDLFPADVAEEMSKEDQQVRLTQRTYCGEREMPLQSGRFTAWTTKFPINAGSGAAHLGGLTLDISARKRLEQQLSQSRARLLRGEEQLRAILETLADGIIILCAGVVRYANAAAGALLGCREPERLVGRALDLGDARASTAPPTTALHTITRSDGTKLQVEEHSSPIDYEGERAVVLILRDVGQRKAAEHKALLTERLASIGTLAGAVAHEINNPLAIMVANLEQLDLHLLADAAAAPRPLTELLEMIEDARGAAERIRRVVNAMGTLARDTSDQPLALVRVTDVVQQAVQLTSNGIRLRAALVKELGPTPPVWADPSQLTQALINLLANAWQAIPPGRADAHCVRVATYTSADNKAVIEVSDDGVGIPPHHRRRIFDPFFTTRLPREGAGLGLGLAIAHRMVTGLRGEIEVASQAVRGTTVRVSLPAADQGALGASGAA